MQQPWWAYLTAVNPFYLSITDNTFIMQKSCQSWFGLPDYNPIVSESQQCWFCLVFIPRMLLCYVLCPADLITLCCVLNLWWAEDVLIVGERLIIRTQWERSMRQKDCQIVPLSTDIWTLHVCAIYIVYIVRPSLHNVCILSHGPTVTSSVHNTLLANKVRGYPQSSSWSVGRVSYMFTDI